MRISWRTQLIGTSVCAVLTLCAVRAEDAKQHVPEELVRIRQMLDDYKPAVWVFVGDSVTHGSKHTKGARSYPEHFAERVRGELKRKSDVVVNMGVSSSTTVGILHNFQWRVGQFDADVVSVMIGINDARDGKAGLGRFRKNIAELVGHIRHTGALPLLNTPNPLLPGRYYPKEFPAYVEAVRQVARENDVPLVDHYKHWTKAKPDPKDLEQWIGDRNVHAGKYGHRELAKQIFKVLEIYDPESPTCRLEVP